MTYDFIKDLLVNKLGIKAEKINLESGIKELGCDSLDIVELVMDVEANFGITIDDDDIVKFTTVEDVVKYIEAKKADK